MQEDLVDSDSREFVNPLKLNSNFARNIIKNTQVNNRISTDTQLRQQRKFLNEERKKHTVKNIGPMSDGKANKTLYSDYVSEKLNEKAKIKDSKMFSQMKKLVEEAAEFDQAMSRKELQNLSQQHIPPPKQHYPRISIDKTLLHNHLQHTSIHNRLKEESQMWEKFDKEKKRLQTKHSTQKKARTVSGMYADFESGPSVTVKINTDDTARRRVGTLADKVKTTGRNEKHRQEKDDTRRRVGMYADNVKIPEQDEMQRWEKNETVRRRVGIFPDKVKTTGRDEMQRWENNDTVRRRVGIIADKVKTTERDDTKQRREKDDTQWRIGMYSDNVKIKERDETKQRTKDGRLSTVGKYTNLRKVILQADSTTPELSRKRKSYETKQSTNETDNKWGHDGFFSLNETSSNEEEPKIKSRVVEPFKKRSKNTIEKETYILSSSSSSLSSDLSSDSSDTETDDEKKYGKMKKHHKKKITKTYKNR